MEVETLIEMRGKDSEEEEGKAEEKDEGPIRLPGFRFHPTDEELVSFYLKRKVEKKPVDVIEQLDIYRYDPWDLPSKATKLARVLPSMLIRPPVLFFQDDDYHFLR